jgi:hypothetical protein
VLIALGAPSALAQPATDYCALLSKEDVEAALKTPVAKVTAAPSARFRPRRCTTRPASSQRDLGRCG